VQGYFLSSYSARKLGMRTTGHAGGSQNLVLTSRLTSPGDDLDAMLKQAAPGLFVTELMGQGVNASPATIRAARPATGSRVGASPTRCTRSPSPATCARCSSGIVAVGADTYTSGSKTVGSVLLGRMKLAGS
jgi:PmbA protein